MQTSQGFLTSNLCSLFFILLFFLFPGYAHAVPMSRTVGLTLRREQGKEENMQKLDGLSGDSTSQQGVFDSLVDEKCDDGVDVEECLKRRMMSEAHLDYIYTQEVKP
ncbi:putative phytosulfokines 6 [Nymphaea colorata]|nr:putative phytosulfokines 6 [Nymphaea colorata]